MSQDASAEIVEYRAAGGVVIDDTGRALLMIRLVTRDGRPRLEVRLPKGHVEPGETDAEAAKREVCEETGYCSVAILHDLGEAITEFGLESRLVRRTEHYYLMRVTGPPGTPHFDPTTPEEALFRIRWAGDLAEAAQALTYGSEREFAGRALACGQASAQ